MGTHQAERLTEKDRRYVRHAMSGHDPTAAAMVVTGGSRAWITDEELDFVAQVPKESLDVLGSR